MHPFESGLRDSDEDSYDGDYPLVSDESSGDLYISNSRPGRRRGDQVTKNMIVNGAVGFHDPLWVEMPEGTHIHNSVSSTRPISGYTLCCSFAFTWEFYACLTSYPVPVSAFQPRHWCPA